MVRAKTRTPPKHADALIRRLRLLQQGPMVGAEVGVLGGSLSRKLLRDLPSLRLHMIDTWAGSGKGARSAGGPLGTPELYEQAMEFTAPYADRRIVHRCDSVEAAAAILDRSLDFVFIDADHRYESVVIDLDAWWPKVRAGGLFCGDDYQNADRLDPKNGRMLCGVKQAVDEFVDRCGVSQLLTVDEGPTWFLRLPGAKQ